MFVNQDDRYRFLCPSFAVAPSKSGIAEYFREDLRQSAELLKGNVPVEKSPFFRRSTGEKSGRNFILAGA
jgi:hypothetical protein